MESHGIQSGGDDEHGPETVTWMVVLERLEGLEREYEAVLAQLSDPAVVADQKRLRETSRRHKELEPIIAALREYRAAEGDLNAGREMLTEATGGEREMLREEIDATEARLEKLDE